MEISARKQAVHMHTRISRTNSVCWADKSQLTIAGYGMDSPIHTSLLKCSNRQRILMSSDEEDGRADEVGTHSDCAAGTTSISCGPRNEEGTSHQSQQQHDNGHSP